MELLITTEYNPIKLCLMAYPNNLRIVDDYTDFINDIDKDLALNQYKNLVNILQENGVEIQFLDLTGEPSQIFTRDIGFVVENTLFISKMMDPVRKSEIQNLIEYSNKNNLHPYIMENEIEGGDVFIHKNHVIVGVGARSTGRAVQELKNYINSKHLNYEIIEVVFDKSKIHLDCVFNIIDEDTCLISKGVFNPEVVLGKFRNVIEVPDSELTTLAPNIISLGNKNILCSNEKFTKILISKGYNATFINFTEVIKAQGSLGCCVLPLIRANQE